MTDKQIIDGVDVSGCEHYSPNIKMDCLLHPLQSDACKNNPNCHYKQLKRKERECKQLREIMHKDFCTHYVLGECSQDHHDNCVGRNQCIKDLEQKCEEQKKELDQLKKENKKLKNEIKDLEDLAKFKTETIRELRKELEAIKGLVTVGNKQITQSLEKVEDLKNELHSKVEFIQEQRNIINEYSKEIEMYKKCQGNRASKREEKLKQTLAEIKEIAEQLYYQAIKDPVKRETAICKIITKINEVDNEN